MNFANLECIVKFLKYSDWGYWILFFGESKKSYSSKICQNGIENFKRKKIFRSHMYEKQYDIILGIKEERRRWQNLLWITNTHFGGSHELFKRIKKERKREIERERKLLYRQFVHYLLVRWFLTLSIYACKFLTFIAQGVLAQ